MLLIIYVIGSATGSRVDDLSLWSGVIGAIALATIGTINIYSMKKGAEQVQPSLQAK
jgi:hypothetical protein